jgi:tetrahydromethanopterin S-methyltransferase subunit G
MSNKTKRELTFWEKDRRIGRGLGIAYGLIAFSVLLLYLSVAWTIVR